MHRSASCRLLIAALAVGVVAGTVTESFYGDTQCKGAPTKSHAYATGKCNLGGVVYECQTGRTCFHYAVYEPLGLSPDEKSLVAAASAAVHALQRRNASFHASRLRRARHRDATTATAALMGGVGNATGDCTGTPVAAYAMPCGQCIGGKYGPSVTIRDCDVGRPTITYCSDGQCSQNCREVAKGVPTGCYGVGNHSSGNRSGAGVKLWTAACSTVSVVDYVDYNTCSGTVLDQVQYVADTCLSGMSWTC